MEHRINIIIDDKAHIATIIFADGSTDTVGIAAGVTVEELANRLVSNLRDLNTVDKVSIETLSRA